MKPEGFKISKELGDKLFSKTDIDILGYESPIDIMIDQMIMKQENGVLEVVQAQEINVDKDELIKALQYDRGQYDKGYVNGYNAGASKAAQEIFEEIEKFMSPYRYPIIAELKKKYEEDGE